MKCVVINCKSSNNGKACEMSFFRFPTDAAMQKKWVLFCRRKKKFNAKTSYICMLHFKNEDFENNLQFEMGFSKKRFLKRDAVPSILNPKNAELYEERANRITKRENKKTVELLLKEYDSNLASNEELRPLDDAYLEQNTLDTNDTIEDLVALNDVNSKQSTEGLDVGLEIADKENVFKFLEAAKEEIAILKSEIQSLQKQLKSMERKHATELTANEEKMEKARRINEYNADNYEKQLAKANFEIRNLDEKLEVIFTKGQIKKLKNGIKKTTWAEEDIAHSITLHAASSKLYKLLYRKGFPLPAVRTLQKWAQKIDVERGLIKPVFKILSANTQMSDLEKVCVLSYDEMKTRKSYCYDKSTDTTLAPVNYVQVAMLRGLMAKWKQPIFYDFDCPMTKDILLGMLEKAKFCGYTVVAMVSDLGGENRSLLNDLGISEEHPWFEFNNQKVFAFADVPHLIKLLRNHFLDKGYVINDKIVKKEIILKLLEVTSHDLNITHKISQANLTVIGAQRQKVKTATKLFSHTVAQAISRAASLGFLDGINWNECYQLFKLTNDWFDVFNVRVPRADSRRRCHAYGLALEEQNNIIDQMTELMKSMRAVGRKALLPFQRGIIQSNNALKGLFTELKGRYDCKFVLTYRLNQDVLENFFGIIRSKGGLHDHPDQQEFKYRLRSYILGRNDAIISQAANVEMDDTPDLDRTQKSLTGLIFSKFSNNEEPSESLLEEEELGDLEYDGLENLTGYICHKLRDQVPDIAVVKDSSKSQSFTWVDHLNEGGLSKPTQKVMLDLRALYSIFEANNNEALLITKHFLKIHLDQASNIDCSDKVKQLFFRARMYFRIRKLNREIVEMAKQRKRKWHKTVQ